MGTYVKKSRYARAIYICVQDASRDALSRCCECEIDRDGALAYAAFGAADGNDVLDVLDVAFLRQSFDTLTHKNHCLR